jgi:signal transduction histidine kinase
MRLLRWFRRRLGRKLFLTYLIVIVVGVVVLATAAEFVLPGAFNRHLAEMAQLMGSDITQIELDLFGNFRQAVNEALTLAALSALLVAVIVSILASRQVVAPIREMMMASQRIAGGRYDERVCVQGDVTRDDLDEIGQLALSFNQMASHLERIEQVRRQLYGDIAHELRTPLTAIKGSMEGLMDGVLPAENETYQRIYKEADRMQHLVEDLQELSRVEAGAIELKRKPIAVQKLLEATISQLSWQAEEKGVSLEMNLPPRLPRVLVDEDRIGQVLLNLVGNSLQYTSEGGRITMKAEGSGDEVRISIIDTGIGISAEHLSYLFTRFYRVDRSRSRVGGGSGIGLTIAKHLVEIHGGRIWAESAGPGLGSTFTFTLPAYK